jgi:hypothetical protein
VRRTPPEGRRLFSAPPTLLPVARSPAPVVACGRRHELARQAQAGASSRKGSAELGGVDRCAAQNRVDATMTPSQAKEAAPKRSAV